MSDATERDAQGTTVKVQIVVTEKGLRLVIADSMGRESVERKVGLAVAAVLKSISEAMGEKLVIKQVYETEIEAEL